MIKKVVKTPFPKEQKLMKNFMDWQKLHSSVFRIREEQRYIFEERKLQPLNC